ncbi:2862_t:CDS:2, partial [Racocetra fulgida]
FFIPTSYSDLQIFGSQLPIQQLPSDEPFQRSKLSECDLRDSVNGSTVNTSHIEFSEELFESISESCDLQLEQSDNIDSTNADKLLIEEIVNLSSYDSYNTKIRLQL